MAKLVAEGKKVTLCLDKTQSAGKNSTHATLRKAGIGIVIKKASALEHNKFCVVDDQRVIMGSWNYSGNAQKQDNSFLDISGCDDIVKQFKDAFTRIYERDK
jgi:phospholipase D